MPAELDRSLVRGSLNGAIWKLAWPTMLINVAGGLQGVVDHVAVGRLVGYHANAGVGVGWQVFAFFVVFVNALYGGVGVLIARFAGAGDTAKLHRTFSQAFAASLVLSVGVFAPLGYFLAPWLLDLVQAAPEVQAEALPYLRILFLLNSGQILFFLLANALRAAGDARTPMHLTISMTALNVVLTVILVAGWGPIPALGTRGAAISSVAAGFAVAAVAYFRLIRGDLVVRFQAMRDWLPQPRILRQILRFGLPMGLQSIALHLGGLVMVGFVGSLESSAEAQAAYSVAYAQIFVVINLVSIGWMLAASTLVGQSLGAGELERAEATPRAAFRMALVFNIPLAVLFVAAPAAFLGLFGIDDPRVLDLGTELLRFLSVSSLFQTAAYVYQGALQGAGDTRSTLVITLVSQLLLPLAVCGTLSLASGLFARGIWLALALGPTLRCALSVWRFRQGRWREIMIDIEEPYQ